MFFICLLFLLMFSCNSNSNLNETWGEAVEFRQNSNLKEAITVFKKIASSKDNLFAVKAQYQIADIYQNDIKDYTFAIQEFEKIIDSYPNSEFAKKSMFMLGYINSNYIESYDDAIKYYNMFLQKYPDDELVPSIQYELVHLDTSGIIKTLEDLRTN